ncbi:Endonuclease/exonuclease/phosphatase [Artemisia annua]|uniref:Endonuclease/exonuclease/phosphatase n=1 Tax=Artemisia annua TaxID=35608 RepID=A0A2U1NKU7_ARTAN|nr:Endonuclease/exonuclease/phosphatase [Artemisia annua]
MLRITRQPTASSDSSSLEVNRTISIGKDLGFNLEGKEPDVAKALGTGVDNGIQESMTCDVNPYMIQSMWGHSSFEYDVKKATGKLGGIIAVWDPSIFSKTSSITGDGFLALSGKWTTIDVKCRIIIVYAPQDLKSKRKLWKDLKTLIISENILSIVMGDFNEVRSASERLGSHFCQRSATIFNEFIASTGLIDLPMGGMRFTRMNRNLKKAIKSWRITVNESETAAATVLRDGIKEIDLKAEVSPLSSADVDLRTSNVRFLSSKK